MITNALKRLTFPTNIVAIAAKKGVSRLMTWLSVKMAKVYCGQ